MSENIMRKFEKTEKVDKPPMSAGPVKRFVIWINRCWLKFCLWWSYVTLVDRAYLLASRQSGDGVSFKDQQGWHVWRLGLCHFTSYSHWKLRFMRWRLKRKTGIKANPL